MEKAEQKSKLSIPIAIIVAGALVAGALYFTRADNAGNPIANDGSPTERASAPIALAAVSGDDHILGSPEADIFIVEFSDTECPFCADFHNTMHSIIDDYGRSGEVAWVYRHFPIVQLHAKAPLEAAATECAAELGGNVAFWNYIDTIFATTPSNDGLDLALLPLFARDIGLDVEAFEECLSSGRHDEVVQRHLEDAVNAGGRGTPYSVIVTKDTLPPETVALVNAAVTELSPDSLVISDDRTKIALNGALPFSIIELLVRSILGLPTEIPSTETTGIEHNL